MIETSHTREQQSAGAFPRIYRPCGGWRAFYLALSLLVSLPAVAGIWYFGTGHETRSTQQLLMLVGVCVLFLLMGLYLAAWVIRAKVTFWPDRIEVRELIRTRVLSRNDILGRRLQPSSPPVIVLVPRDKSQKQMKLAQMYNFDAAFRTWTDSVPDLDAQEARTAEQEIANNEEIGSSPDDRREALKRGKRLSGFVTFVTIALGAWAWIYPQPYRLVISLLALLPWAAMAIVARSGGLFKIDTKRNDPHPSVGIAFMMPGFVLVLRVLSDMNALKWTSALYLTMALGTLLGVAAVMADRSLKNNVGMAILVLLLSSAYGYGAGMEANALLDRSAASIFTSRIIGKSVSSGKHTSYDLNLNPWGPKEDAGKVSVSRRFYEGVRVDDPVCIVLRNGALHVPWYTVHRCPTARQ